MQVYTTLPLFL